jgi:hypothetical protein
MANSQNNPSETEDQQRFRLLDRLYTISEGYSEMFVPQERLGVMTDNEQNSIKEALHFLAESGLVTLGLGNVKITHEGIIEYEDAILNPHDHTELFPLDTIQSVSTESKKEQVRTIQRQRSEFLDEALRLSGGNLMQPVSDSDIESALGYNHSLVERIHFFCQDAGLIQAFATGGKFTLTPTGIRQAQEDPIS